MYYIGDSKDYHGDFHFCRIFIFFTGKSQKLLFWNILGHNSRTTRHGNSEQIFGFLDSFYIRLVYFSEKIFFSFLVKQMNWKNMTLPIPSCLNVISYIHIIHWCTACMQHTGFSLCLFKIIYCTREKESD